MKNLILNGTPKRDVSDTMHLARAFTDGMNEVQKNGGKAAYFMFGTELLGEHHQNTFDFNEDVLAIMAETYSRILLKK